MPFYLMVLLTGLYCVSRLPTLLNTQAANYNLVNFAHAVNALVGPNEYYWAGPYPYEDVLRVQGKPATRYIFYFPWQASSPAYRQEVLQQLQAHMPKVVYYNYDVSIWNIPASSYSSNILFFLKGEYFNLENMSPSAKYIFFRHDVSTSEAINALRQNLK